MSARRLLMLAARALLRDWRGGELRVLAAALVIACAAVAAVGFFTDRMHLVMERQAGELLGADLVLQAPQPADDAVVAEATRRGLAVAHTVTLRSVAVAGDITAFTEAKAVGPGYPLRGELRISDAPYADARPTRAIPAPGTAWIDERLAGELGLALGGTLELGTARLRIAQILAYEPDRGGDLFSIAPRLMFNLADLPGTGLIQPGSRVEHRLLVAGEAAAVADYRSWLAAHTPVNARAQGVRDARPELRAALDRAERFLGLAAVVAAILAGVGIAIAARRFASRHWDAVAILRCLGATQRQVLLLFLFELLLLGALAGLAGAALGWLAQEGLARILGVLAGGELPAPSWRPLPAALATGFIALFGFAVPPLLQLRRVPPLRVLRRDLAPADAWSGGVYLAALAAIAALLLWQAGDAKLAGLVLAGCVGAAAALAAAAFAALQLVGRLRARVGMAWRFGLANLVRRGPASVVQAVAIGLGIMVLLVLGLVRQDLLAGWRASLPADAPNHFLINIQPQEVAGVRAFLHARALTDTTLYPMVRGRLTRIGEREVAPADYAEPRAQRLVEREFNLSVGTELPSDNRVTAGRWFTAADAGQPVVSVEQGLAETLGIRLGDRLRFVVAGQAVEARVVGLRSVEWDSFHVNFFVVFPPGVIDALPATWITSFHLPRLRQAVLAELVRAFPSVTVLDLDALMVKVREIIDRVVLAVEYVFLFTLAAGLAVLFAAIQATRDERRFEAAVVRTLGASRAVVRHGLLVEFAALGLLAGVLAACAAAAVGWGVAEFVFTFRYRPDVWLWLVGAAAGAGGVGLAGWLGTREVLAQPPLRTLREG